MAQEGDMYREHVSTVECAKSRFDTSEFLKHEYCSDISSALKSGPVRDVDLRMKHATTESTQMETQQTPGIEQQQQEDSNTCFLPLSPRDPQLFGSPSQFMSGEPSFLTPRTPEVSSRERRASIVEPSLRPSGTTVFSSNQQMSEDPLLALSRAASMSQTFDTSRAETQRLIKLMHEMGERLNAVEREQNILKRKVFASSQASQNTPATTDNGATILSPTGESESGNTLDPSHETELHTSLSQTIDALDGTLQTKPPAGRSPGTKVNRRQSENHVSLGDIDVVSPSSRTNVTSPDTNARISNVASLRRAFDLWFTNINPNLPFINENQFRLQFENHLVTGGNEGDPRSKDLFVVLANLIYAESMLLSEHSPAESAIPGWPEFCYADRILSRVSWLSRGNMQIIQCLMIKARYLSTIQRIRSAYDTMCKAVQICFYTGLHNEPRWSNITPFEKTMRQRIFWSLFYMDRGIALGANMPYLLRESDFNVEFPARVGDRYLYPNRPLPEESPTFSFIPYLESCMKWSQLCSTIWDAMFTPNSPKPASEELITSLDTEILYSICSLPQIMQWDPSALQPGRRSDIPRYIKRHMCLSHLHTNHLRLVMRHRALVTLTCSRKMAEESIWIAASTTDAVDAYRSSNQHAHMFRFSAAMFLTAAIIPLICVIVQENKPASCTANGSTSTTTTNKNSGVSNNSSAQSAQNQISPTARDEAIRAFGKALSILREISPGFGIAALMLHRLDAAIQVASSVIEKLKQENNPSLPSFPINSADGMSDLQMDEGVSQNLLDLFKDFEKPYDEVAANQEMLFWGGDGLMESMGGGGCGGAGGGVTDMSAANLNCQFDWSLSVPIV
ncbi:uncharacterized protein BDZ99DRAFT_573269 [Mytilinidion resinicola]|uniref:Xylanolytic transcriptional activator regulatory domain-containing protein n=1 Tax=Mytilinidion resinicola TaxID=574789 RepID=A0A6A6YF72_9PEZI|nr:uncharacterized protein BDZ99DRAFT_573269 [Mytilinidion resinicola]KAF2807442.1 hypothetical protein BDZ99DRAFT_573269 [Mytilinidion resinicola]